MLASLARLLGFGVAPLPAPLKAAQEKARALDPLGAPTGAEFVVAALDGQGGRLGAILMRGGRILVGQTREGEFDPREKDGVGALALDDLIGFMGGAALVGFGIAAVRVRIDRAMRARYGADLANLPLDALALARRLHEGDSRLHNLWGAAAPTLASLAEHYGIALSPGAGALKVAFAEAQVYQRLLALLPERGLTTIRDLVRMAR